MSIQPFIVKRSKVLPMFSLLSNTVVHPHNSLSPENMVAVIPQPLTQQNPTNLHTPSVRMTIICIEYKWSVLTIIIMSTLSYF